jgi:hypothetical protein
MSRINLFGGSGARIAGPLTTKGQGYHAYIKSPVAGRFDCCLTIGRHGGGRCAVADPEVTIRTEGDKTIQEYRQNGFLYAIKVTPKGGKPYFLVRADGTDANFIRSDQPDMLIPSWKIFEWK